MSRSSQHSIKTDIDENVERKMPPLRITKMKTKMVYNQSHEEYIDEVIRRLKRKYSSIEEKILPESIQQSLKCKDPQGLFSVRIICHWKIIKCELTKVINTITVSKNTDECSSKKVPQYIIFFVRSNTCIGESGSELVETFALTSGGARRLLQEDEFDEEFPRKIARRVLEFHLKSLSSKPLMGVHSAKELTYRPDGGTCLTFWDYLGNITSRYTMPLRPDSSLYTLRCFQSKKGKPLKASITVGVNHLSFHNKMSLGDYASTLRHLSLISRGDKTFRFCTNEVEEDDVKFDVLYHVSIIKNKSILKKLNKELKEKIVRLIENKDKKVDMLFCYKEPQIWETGHEFALHMKVDGQTRHKELETWSVNPPTVREVLEVVQKRVSSFEYKDVFDRLFLKFHNVKIEKLSIKCKILSCVESHFQSKTGIPYFLHCGKWMQINGEFLVELDKNFTDILEQCSLEEDILPLSWPHTGKTDTDRLMIPTTKDRFNCWVNQICEYEFIPLSSGDFPVCSVHFDEYPDGEKTTEIIWQLFLRMNCHQTEENYNAGYIMYTHITYIDSGYLLGDRILMKNIELYDILYYTPEKTYLIHVKNGFGHETREACSQIRISADLVFRNLICTNKLDIFKQLWEVITTYDQDDRRPTSKYRSAVKKQYLEFGETAFRKLFLREEIVFVFAYRDSGIKGQRQKNPTVSYKDEIFEEVFPTEVSQQIKAELLRCEYLKESDGKITITDKVFNTLKKAEQDIKLRPKSKARKVFRMIQGTVSRHKSNIARMEIVHLFSHFKQFWTPSMRLTLKVCSLSKE